MAYEMGVVDFEGLDGREEVLWYGSWEIIKKGRR